MQVVFALKSKPLSVWDLNRKPFPPHLMRPACHFTDR